MKHLPVRQVQHGLGYRTITTTIRRTFCRPDRPSAADSVGSGEIVRRERMGGLLNYYRP
jgi:hypothetical protein